jgi:beta-phosphoglucomutase-like phosphatase (HAD superfamily)
VQASGSFQLRRYAAAIFDLDGLLLDTERLAREACAEALESLGATGGEGLFERLVGKDELTSARLVADHFGPDFPIQEFGTRWNLGFRTRTVSDIPLRPGAVELLDALAELRVPRALATSSQRTGADRKLKVTGLRKYFGAVVTVNCVTRPKPAPDPYLLAAARLHQDPARCIAFEDSDTGAAAAQAAGMVVVQIPDQVPTDGRHAHHLAESLMDGARMAGLL